jgi:hypothetical protein
MDRFTESNLAFTVSPQHASGPSSPAAMPSFQQAFSTTEPAPLPDPNRRRVARSLAKFWDENIPESLKSFPIASSDVFVPICMTPTKEQVGRMYARSKCMELLTTDHPSLLSSPTRSQPLCFVAKAGEGLPIHIQKTLFFFASVLHGLQDMSHFAAPTIATDVVVRASLAYTSLRS